MSINLNSTVPTKTPTISQRNQFQRSLGVVPSPIAITQVPGTITIQGMTSTYTMGSFLYVDDPTAVTEINLAHVGHCIIDASSMSNLTTLNCSFNALTALDVTGCAALNTLDCGYSGLTSLDVSGCNALRFLSCNNNQLTASSVDNIIIDLNTNGITTGYLNLSGGTSAAPSAASAAALANLTAPQPGGLGWVVITN